MVPERGLREGCPSSPPLLNIYHQGSMRTGRLQLTLRISQLELRSIGFQEMLFQVNQAGRRKIQMQSTSK